MSVDEQQHQDEHKTIVRRLFDDAINARNWDHAERFIASNVIDHTAPSWAPPGIAGFKQQMIAWFSAFPDSHFDIDDMIAQGDRVTIRWTVEGTQEGIFRDIPPTGKHITMSGIDEVRIAFGQIVEHWGYPDLLGLLDQLGAAPWSQAAKQ